MPGILWANWALFVGMGLLMVGNGLQASLVGVRGPLEGFSTLQISTVMSAYFAGFLVSSTITPRLIRRVGHVRVFAALGSLISAALILFPVITEPVAWALLRALLGFCFCGVYITAESWLNNATTTANRGSALSVYMLVQLTGVVAAQGILALGDPSGFILFIVPSVLVSISFAPILLSVGQAPAYEHTKSMRLGELFRASPLGLVGIFLLGGIFAAQFGMSAVYGSQAGLSGARLSAFLAAFYVGGLVLQVPVGWLSDRVDRRVLILVVSAGGAAAAVVGWGSGGAFPALIVAAALVGGLANPLYALLIAYVGDVVEYEDMAAASGGLLLVNAIGAVAGPPAIAALMDVAGPRGFWAFCAVVLGAIAGYAAYRMLRRPVVPVAGESAAYAPVFAGGSRVAAEAAVVWSDPQSDAEAMPGHAEGNR